MRKGSRKESEGGRLVGYVRVSTKEQSREGVSLDAQRQRLEAYALAHGAELVGIESDEGISGSTIAKRDGLQAALRQVRAGEADGLLVLKLDRLSRRVRDTLDLMDESRRRGWRLVSVSEHLDTGSAAGRLVVTVLAALNEMERELISERTTEALAHITREGRACSRFVPFGWRTADGKTQQRAGGRRPLVEDAGEQKLRRLIVKLRRSGLGARRITRQLNESGTNPRTGSAWTVSTVAALVRTIERRAEVLAA